MENVKHHDQVAFRVPLRYSIASPTSYFSLFFPLLGILLTLTFLPLWYLGLKELKKVNPIVWTLVPGIFAIQLLRFLLVRLFFFPKLRKLFLIKKYKDIFFYPHKVVIPLSTVLVPEMTSISKYNAWLNEFVKEDSGAIEISTSDIEKVAVGNATTGTIHSSGQSTKIKIIRFYLRHEKSISTRFDIIDPSSAEILKKYLNNHFLFVER